MRPIQPAIRILAAIALVALAAIALLWFAARTSLAREWLGGRLAEATGLPVTVGELDVGFLPRLSLSVGQFTIAQPAGFGMEPLVEVGRARVSLPWGGLFGATRLQDVSVEDAVVRLATAADGHDNWSDLVARLTADENEAPSGWSVGSVSVDRGALEYRDPETAARFTAITLSASDIAPAAEFPLDLRLAALSGSRTYHFGATGRGRLDPDSGRYLATGLALRGWAGGEPLPLAGVELDGGIAVVSYDSADDRIRIEQGRFTVAGASGAWQAEGRFGEQGTQVDFAVDTDDFAPRPVALALGRPLPVTADPAAYGEAQLSLRGRWQAGGLVLDPITGRVDETRFTGRAAASQRQLRLHADRIHVDRYLAPGEKSRRSKKATLEAAIEQLGTFDIDAELRIDEARVAGARLKDAIVRIERQAGAP